MKLNALKNRKICLHYENQEEGLDCIYIDEVEGFGILVEFEDRDDYQEIIPFRVLRGIGVIFEENTSEESSC